MDAEKCVDDTYLPSYNTKLLNTGERMASRVSASARAVRLVRIRLRRRLRAEQSLHTPCTPDSAVAGNVLRTQHISDLTQRRSTRDCLYQVLVACEKRVISRANAHV